jgi:hypothetical protein
MLMKDPGRHWGDREPYRPPGSLRPYLLLLLAISIALVLVAALVPLRGPATRCVRPVGWHVGGRVALPLCNVYGPRRGH